MPLVATRADFVMDLMLCLIEAVGFAHNIQLLCNICNAPGTV